MKVVSCLLEREWIRLWTEKSRWVGVVAQPLMFWILLGFGFGHSFKPQGAETTGFLEFFFPGSWLMCLLLTCIFGSMSIIEDRKEGFLQGVLASPASKMSILVGKIGGIVFIGLIQSLFFFALSPLAGYPYKFISVGFLFLTITLGTAGLASLNIFFAWWLNSASSYHAVMSAVLIPFWLLSGAVFPLQTGFFRIIGWVNPLAYFQTAMRLGLHKADFSAEFMSQVFISFGGLLLWGALFFILALRRMQNVEEK